MKLAISAVVTAREEAPNTLAATVDGLLAAGLREVIVIDDASLAPVSLVREGVRVVRNPEPWGVARSRRLGAVLAEGEVLIFTDAHMHFAPDCVARMLEHVGCGALLCAAWWNYELTRPLCWGGEFLWCADRNYKAGRTPGFGFRHLTRLPAAEVVEIPMVVGACYMMLRDSYERMGGFSPFFRVWGRSEQDISARAWITGVGVRCVTAARAGHLSRGRFPYPVRFSDIEFNQVAMVRTVFEEPLSAAIEAMLAPLPEDVEIWLRQADFSEFRGLVQCHRQMSDEEFFRRFVREAPPGIVC